MSAPHPIILGLMMVASGLSADAQPVAFQSTESQTALLELFTSEGCSSCPPAEAWLSELKQSPGLWKQFVPVAFHVDYWDHMGWRDRWAAKEFSDRQRAYAQSWRSDSIYTPGFVLNGREWREWARSKDGLGSSEAKAGVLKISSKDLRHWQASFSPAVRNAGDYEAHAALLANGLVSDVKTGENRGRHLNHDFVVTALNANPLKKAGDKAEGEFELTLPKQGEARRPALAVWVTRLGSFEPLQATGGRLP